MKHFLLVVLCLSGTCNLSAQITFTALKLEPAYPKQNSTVSFEYDKTNSPLEKQSKVDIVVYLFNDEGYKVAEPEITQTGNVSRGKVSIDAKTNFIAFGFSAFEEKDMNGNKGFFIPVYTEKDIPVIGYYAAAANFHNFYGQNLLGLPTEPVLGLGIMEEGIKQYPDIKNDMVFLNTYIATLGRAKNKEAAPLIDAELATLAKNKPMTEKVYNMLIQNETKNKRNAAADSLIAAMKADFPNGDWVKREDMQLIRSAKGGDKKAEAYKTFIKKYPPTEQDKPMVDFLTAQVANSYAGEKNYKAYNEWNGKLDKAAMSLNNNNSAWAMAEAGENMEDAKNMAHDATIYAKAEMESPAGKRPQGMTTKQWEAERKNNYAMYGDTYAFILYKLGDYKTALPISKEAATMNKLKDAEYNERYAMIAEKVLPTSEAKKLIEGFVKDGTASSATKESLKNVYVRENNGDKGYEEYMAGLQAEAMTRKREAIAKDILNEASPTFSLKDFEGKTVSLDELKGKVIVVDFWATWCGPCIASMPGMNKALTKYKDNPDVKFLFVDTWENVEDKLKNAKTFMDKKKYRFYVLMDNDNKMVEDFKVNGIPTKFVIDKAGKIRFKAVGFSGNDDALVDELSTMIELASK
ncbi:MAG: TlpA disulfide reductase family protein [Ferruginibacter sp.]